MTQKLSIKDWALEDRPREKLIAKGLQSLSDAELVAILIGSGNRNESAVELSKRILKNVDNNLNLLGKQNLSDLQKFKGIGEAKAISIVAAMELGRRRKLSDIKQRKVIRTSKDVFEFFHPILADLPHEEFWVLFLNQSNKVIDKYRASYGGITSTTIDVRLIMKTAIEKLATSMILCHNHPSGGLNPSISDKEITQKLRGAGKIMDIKVLDHVIVTDESFYSFGDEGV